MSVFQDFREGKWYSWPAQGQSKGKSEGKSQSKRKVSRVSMSFRVLCKKPSSYPMLMVKFEAGSYMTRWGGSKMCFDVLFFFLGGGVGVFTPCKLGNGIAF